MVTERYGPAEVLQEINSRRLMKNPNVLNAAVIPPKSVVRGAGNHFIITPAELVEHINSVRSKDEMIRTIIATPRPKCAGCKALINLKGMTPQFGPSERVQVAGRTPQG